MPQQPASKVAVVQKMPDGNEVPLNQAVVPPTVVPPQPAPAVDPAAQAPGQMPAGQVPLAQPAAQPVPQQMQPTAGMATPAEALTPPPAPVPTLAEQAAAAALPFPPAAGLPDPASVMPPPTGEPAAQPMVPQPHGPFDPTNQLLGIQTPDPALQNQVIPFPQGTFAEQAPPPMEQPQLAADVPLAPNQLPVIAPMDMTVQQPQPVMQPVPQPQAPVAQLAPVEGLPQTMIPLGPLDDYLAQVPVVDVDAILATCPWVQGGPSEGGISHHTVAPFKTCRRQFYLSRIRGLRKKERAPHFEFGSLFHAIMEAHRRSGGQATYEPCQLVANAGGADLAGQVWTLANVFLQKLAPEEAALWAYRALEQNAVMWLPAEKVHGKQVRIPASCRHDALVYLKGSPEEPHPGDGPVNGVWIEDLKTAGRNTEDLTRGFGMDPQFLMNCLVYQNSDEVERFGPLAGVIVSIGFKHKRPTPESSVVRLTVPLQQEALESFYFTDLKPNLIELYGAVTHGEREDEKRWPLTRCSTGSCVHRYGMCEFFDICDYGAGRLDTPEAMGVIETQFEVVESRIIQKEHMSEPPAEVKKVKGIPIDPRDAAQAKADAQSAKTKEKNATKKKLAEGVQKELLKAFNEHRADPNTDRLLFDKSNYLVPNHTEKSVKEKLEEILIGLFAVGTTFTLPTPAEEPTPDAELSFTLTAKGYSWKITIPDPKKEGQRKNKTKGSFTWKTLAAALCKDWWDTSQLAPQPPRAPSDPTAPVAAPPPSAPPPPAPQPDQQQQQMDLPAPGSVALPAVDPPAPEAKP
jgi:hypothetical protein